MVTGFEEHRNKPLVRVTEGLVCADGGLWDRRQWDTKRERRTMSCEWRADLSLEPRTFSDYSGQAQQPRNDPFLFADTIEARGERRAGHVANELPPDGFLADMELLAKTC